MARRNSLFVPLVAVVISGSAGAFLFSMVNSDETKAVLQAPPIIKEAPTVQVLVANRNITVGKRVSSNDLSWRAWPENLLNKEYITRNENPDRIESFIGGIAKIPIVSGEPIIEGKIVQPGERGAMAILLRKGMRAVSVPISANTSAGGFILPGDFVDVILTTGIIRESLLTSEVSRNVNGTTSQKPVLKDYLDLRELSRLKDPENKKFLKEAKASKKVEDRDNQNNIILRPESNKKILLLQSAENNLVKRISNEEELLVANNAQMSELMLENVRVLAIDQFIDKSEAKGDGGFTEESPAVIGVTATLEVTPEQAKLLAWAGTNGTMTLSLRAFSENMSDEDGLSADEKLPITRTSFALPINRILNNSNPIISKNSNNVVLIRNGRISSLQYPLSNNSIDVPKSDTNQPDNNAQKSAISLGGHDVQR